MLCIFAWFVFGQAGRRVGPQFPDRGRKPRTAAEAPSLTAGPLGKCLGFVWGFIYFGLWGWFWRVRIGFSDLMNFLSHCQEV